MTESGATWESQQPMDVPPPGPAETAAQPPRRSAFWMTLLLIVALVGCKAADMWTLDPPLMPSGWWKVGAPALNPLISFLAKVALISHEDVLYAIGLGIAAQVLLWLTWPLPRLQRALWIFLLVIFTINALFGLASVKLFEYLHQPLTWPMLYSGNDAKNMQSSIGHYLSVGLFAIGFLVPFLYVLLSCLATIRMRRAWVLTPIAQAIVVVGAMAVAATMGMLLYNVGIVQILERTAQCRRDGGRSEKGAA